MRSCSRLELTEECNVGNVDAMRSFSVSEALVEFRSITCISDGDRGVKFRQQVHPVYRAPSSSGSETPSD